MIELLVDRDVCFGSGECVLMAPDVFELDQTGIARVRADAGAMDPDAADRVASNCPSGAISVAAAAAGPGAASEEVTR
jgi:ferredoxin